MTIRKIGCLSCPQAGPDEEARQETEKCVGFLGPNVLSDFRLLSITWGA